MKSIPLNGPWTVRQRGTDDRFPAEIPGCIHTDLLAARRIPDPFVADNEKKLMWIGETDWVYDRTFTVEKSVLTSDHIELVCDGLDTLAQVKINGRAIGRTDNAFRVWTFDVKRHLKPGKNTIEIIFSSPIPYIRRAQKKRYLALTGVGRHRIDGSNQIRKSQCNFGWDWGPICVTSGIWRSIGIRSYTIARIESVGVTQDHTRRDSTALDVTVAVEPFTETSLSTKITVEYQGNLVADAILPLIDGAGEERVRIPGPRLWWPNGLGDQPLYTVTVVLYDAGQKELDRWSRRIGIRRLELARKPDKWGESFQFLVNGRPFFAKGANWIPADTFVTRIGREHYEYLIRSAAESNMNMLRVWGGGIYEDDAFYELCDEYGICIWQDFMFACSAYPAGDAEFLENVEHEARDTILRLRTHPSLALWCGNNEIEQMAGIFIGEGPGRMTTAEYASLFELLPRLVRELDPERAYWPSSPHSPCGDRADYNNPECGDAHLWDVWHGRKPFEWYRSCEHRFNSEFGFQSFPEPRVVEGYAPSEERNITSYIMELHQRSGIGNDAIIQYMLSWFRLPHRFGMTLWLSQILQGIAMKYAVEHWRRDMPRGMGTLYWQLNDCWPVASWSSVDYEGHWKALHYMARRFFAPLLLSAVEDPDTGSVTLYLINDYRKSVEGRLSYTAYHTDGRKLSSGGFDAKITPLKSKKLKILELGRLLEEHGARNVVIELSFETADRGEAASTGAPAEAAGKSSGGATASRVVTGNLVTFVRPKHLTLQKPEIECSSIAAEDGSYRCTFSSNVPALWVWPELEGMEACYEDRFFHLMPGKSVEIDISPEQEIDADSFGDVLRVYSLRDTYS